MKSIKTTKDHTALPKQRPKYRIEVFKQITMRQGSGQEWRWHLLSMIGAKKIVCTSGEAFYSRANALRAARRMQRLLIEGLGASTIEFVTETQPPKRGSRT